MEQLIHEVDEFMYHLVDETLSHAMVQKVTEFPYFCTIPRLASIALEIKSIFQNNKLVVFTELMGEKKP